MEQVQSFFEESRDKPRHRPLVTMRVTNDTCMGLPVHGNIVPIGTHEIEVYDDHVDAVLAMVEKDLAAVEAAKAAYATAIAEQVAEHLTGFRGTAADLADEIARPESTYSEELREAVKYVRASTSASWQGQFRKTKKRDPLPLSAAELIPGTGRIEPAKKRELEAQSHMVAALRAALGAEQAPDLRSVVREELEGLLKKPAAAKGK